MGGIVTTETNEEYHEDISHVSSSMLKSLLDSPRIFEGKHITGTIKESQAKHFVIGRAVHCLALEPQFFNQQFAIAPCNDRRLKPFKSWAATQEAEKQLLTKDEGAHVIAAVKSLGSHPTFGSCMASGGVVEQSHRWVDEDAGGVPCRFRPDKLCLNTRIVLDLKTVETCSAYRFQKNAADFWYDVQAAHYEAGAVECYGDVAWYVLFAVVEVKPPYRMRIFKLSDDDLEAGRVWRDHAMQEYARRTLEDDWADRDETNIIPTELAKFTRFRKEI